jgi:hypothetical protein
MDMILVQLYQERKCVFQKRIGDEGSLGVNVQFKYKSGVSEFKGLLISIYWSKELYPFVTCPLAQGLQSQPSAAWKRPDRVSAGS